MRIRRGIAIAGTATMLLAVLVVPPGSAAANTTTQEGPVVVVTGLDNPRQLAWAHRHILLVGEAGRGGDDCSDLGGFEVCRGNTAGVAVVFAPQYRTNTAPQRLIKSLLSVAGADGGFAHGASAVDARSLTKIYVAMFNAPPPVLGDPPNVAQAGTLLKIRPFRARQVADLSAIEEQTDPDGQGVDSNPYSVLAQPHRVLALDAAGNTLLEFKNGEVSVLTVFPDHDGFQAVPTALALGPDGNLYVGDLNGENPGTARVWKVSPSGRILGWIGGFSTVVGVAFGPDRAMYVSQLFADNGAAAPPGQLTRVHNDVRQSVPVPFPAGVATDRAGNVYLSVWSIADRDGTALGPEMSPPGQLWRFSRWSTDG